MCVMMLMLDLSSAFDTVNHQIIIDRLASRFGVTLIKWIECYLPERTQLVTVEGVHTCSLFDHTLDYITSPPWCGVVAGVAGRGGDRVKMGRNVRQRFSQSETTGFEIKVPRVKPPVWKKDPIETINELPHKFFFISLQKLKYLMKPINAFFVLQLLFLFLFPEKNIVLTGTPIYIVKEM